MVKPLVASLAIGEVSEPLPIPGGIAIFQQRSQKADTKIKLVNFLKLLNLHLLTMLNLTVHLNAMLWSATIFTNF